MGTGRQPALWQVPHQDRELLGGGSGGQRRSQSVRVPPSRNGIERSSRILFLSHRRWVVLDPLLEAPADTERRHPGRRASSPGRTVNLRVHRF